MKSRRQQQRERQQCRRSFCTSFNTITPFKTTLNSNWLVCSSKTRWCFQDKVQVKRLREAVVMAQPEFPLIKPQPSKMRCASLTLIVPSRKNYEYTQFREQSCRLSLLLVRVFLKLSQYCCSSLISSPFLSVFVAAVCSHSLFVHRRMEL